MTKITEGDKGFLDWYAQGRLALVSKHHAVVLSQHSVFLGMLCDLIIKMDGFLSSADQAIDDMADSHFEIRQKNDFPLNETEAYADNSEGKPMSDISEVFSDELEKLSLLSEPEFLQIISHSVFRQWCDLIPEFNMLVDRLDVDFQLFFAEKKQYLKNSVEAFLNKKNEVVIRLVQLQSKFVTTYTEYLLRSFDSSAHLLRIRGSYSSRPVSSASA